jgi:FKBP-type peptidyl-prolyl cis-trans isomerase FklB
MLMVLLKMLNLLCFFVFITFFERLFYNNLNKSMKILSNLSFTTLFLIVFSVSIANAQSKSNGKAKPKPKAVPAQASAKAKAVTMSKSILNTSLDSLSYAIGINIGENLRNQKINANPEILAMAIKDALASNNGVMNSETCQAYIQSYFQKTTSKVGDENKMKGDAFLAKNKSQAGVMTLPSGLQYMVINEGTGSKPAETDKVKVHYHGTLIDGTIFDSSVDRGTPAEFGVTQVIKGWVEALQLMNTGAKWKLFIPSDLAYGPQGPPSIGPNQVLIFDVELIEIVK